MILSTLRRTFNSHPVLKSIAIYTSMIGAADITCQLIERKPTFDWTRFRNMSTLGIIYYGPVMHYYYGYLDRKLPGKSPRTIVLKMFIDQCVFTIPSIVIFYTLIGTLERKPWVETKHEVRHKFLPTYVTSCLFWPTAQALNFAVVPPSLRVTYVSVMSFIWLSFLSFVKNQSELPGILKKIDSWTSSAKKIEHASPTATVQLEMLKSE